MEEEEGQSRLGKQSALYVNVSFSYLSLHGILDTLGVEGRKPEVERTGHCSYYLKLSIEGLAPS